MRSTSANRRAVLIGTESLLTECGDLLLSRGHGIAAVVTQSHAIRHWADERGIPVLEQPKELIGFGALGQIDWLFSITYLSVLPPEVLAIPSRIALNFHDGPLPNYVGLNTPAWALINQEAAHGITWHRMTNVVDAGHVLASRPLPLASDETSLTINARCFTAALESFGDVISMLEQDQVDGTPQSGSGKTYRRADRPDGAMSIRWTDSPEAISALVRALDFGPYTNPLGLPTTQYGGKSITLHAVEVQSSRSGAEPGTILPGAPDDLRVATGGSDLRITRMRVGDGQIVSGAEGARVAGILSGGKFNEPTEAARSSWRDLTARAAKHEAYWVRQLAALRPTMLPVQAGKTATFPVPVRLTLDVPAPLRPRGTDALAAAATALADVLQLPMIEAKLTHVCPGQVAPWFASTVPVRLQRLAGERPEEYAARNGAVLHDAMLKLGIAHDVGLRYPELKGVATNAATPLTLSITAKEQAGLVPGSLLTLWTAPDGSESAWFADSDQLAIADVEQWLSSASRLLQQQEAGAERVATVRELTPMQASLLEITRRSEAPATVQIVSRFTEGLHPTRWQVALEQLTANHEALRTRIHPSGSAEILTAVTIGQTEMDWRDRSVAEQAASLRRFQLQDRSRGFDLSQAPLSRITKIQTGDQDCWVVWTASALVLDIESMQQLWTELQQLYAGESATAEADPAVLNRWVTGRDSKRDQTFWRPRLNDVTAPTSLPGDESRSVSGELLAERTLSTGASDAIRALGSLGTSAAAAWSVVLSRSASTDDVLFGVSQSLRRGSLRDGGTLIGQVRTLLPFRARLATDGSIATLLKQTSDELHALQGHALAPLPELRSLSAVPATQPLFESVVVHHAAQAGYHEPHEASGLPLTLVIQDGSAIRLTLTGDARRFRQETLERLLNQVEAILGVMAGSAARRLGGSAELRVDEISLLDERERESVLESVNQTACPYPSDARVHDLIAAQVAKTPDQTAVIAGSASLTYRELDARSNQLARHLATLGVGPDVRVGLALSRTPDLLVGILGIHKAGGAYVPLDPSYPADRLEYMLTDSGAKALVTETMSAGALPAGRVPTVMLDQLARDIDASPFDGGASSENLAYTIYTSGSTGKPKGVMVEHRNVANFFIGMDQRLGTEPGTWLAVTSPSFDISVLELCWTLARGFTVVLAATDQPAALVPVKRAGSTRPVSFSLYYFASGESNEGDKYRLLLEGAKFADEHGFEAVWTPERHFHAFGGLYPSPAVASAALASITTRVKIRAGSVVLPLHHPIRVAEEWALVDNLSKGRVGISFASGWQPNDFVLRPDAFSKQKEIMMRDIDVVRRLWRGETIPFPGAQGKDVPIRTLPRPVQAELPFWITTAGNPESFAAAGKAGAGVLTHLLGQSVEELGPKLESYRAAWKAAGHEGEGRVSLMLHAFVGEDPEFVREQVRGPMVEYLRSSVSLIKHYAWAFPTFRNAPKTGDGGVDLTTLSEDELNALLEHAFDRYYKTSGLFGTPENCLAMVDAVRAIGVDEIACLIDFGVPTQMTLDHLPLLDQVRRMATADPAEDRSLAAELRRHQVTHLQCTPVLARLLAASSEAQEGLRGLKRMMVGGEAFPAALSDALRKTVGGEIHNMYGPTETTIWSTTHKVTTPGNVPLGAPIANTRVYVLDKALQPVPIGVPGELVIGGAGVTRGYLGRPELTAERFVRDPFVSDSDARMYRTGDLVRWRPDGALEFLGRLDHQVKVRGFRIELGEIEAALRAIDIVADTVVIVREDGEDKRIVAYVVAKQGAPQDAGRLRDALRAGLPEYMVPGAFVFMDALPLTLNGKVDRKQLPDPATVAGARGSAGGAPSSALEQSIAAIWKDVLQTGTVGLDDNFFDIGGHSLLAVQAHRRMRDALQKDLPITALFQYPTVRMLAAHLDNGGSASETVKASVDRAEGRRAAMARRVATRRGDGN